MQTFILRHLFSLSLSSCLVSRLILDCKLNSCLYRNWNIRNFPHFLLSLVPLSSGVCCSFYSLRHTRSLFVLPTSVVCGVPSILCVIPVLCLTHFSGVCCSFYSLCHTCSVLPTSVVCGVPSILCVIPVLSYPLQWCVVFLLFFVSYLFCLTHFSGVWCSFYSLCHTCSVSPTSVVCGVPSILCVIPVPSHPLQWCVVFLLFFVSYLFCLTHFSGVWCSFYSLCHTCSVLPTSVVCGVPSILCVIPVLSYPLQWCVVFLLFFVSYLFCLTHFSGVWCSFYSLCHTCSVLPTSVVCGVPSILCVIPVLSYPLQWCVVFLLFFVSYLFCLTHFSGVRCSFYSLCHTCSLSHPLQWCVVFLLFFVSYPFFVCLTHFSGVWCSFYSLCHTCSLSYPPVVCGVPSILCVIPVLCLTHFSGVWCSFYSLRHTCSLSYPLQWCVVFLLFFASYLFFVCLTHFSGLQRPCCCLWDYEHHVQR